MKSKKKSKKGLIITLSVIVVLAWVIFIFAQIPVKPRGNYVDVGTYEALQEAIEKTGMILPSEDVLPDNELAYNVAYMNGGFFDTPSQYSIIIHGVDKTLFSLDVRIIHKSTEDHYASLEFPSDISGIPANINEERIEFILNDIAYSMFIREDYDNYEHEGTYTMDDLKVLAKNIISKGE